MPNTELIKLSNDIYCVKTDPIFNVGLAGRTANHIDYTQPKETIRIEEKRLISSALDLPLSQIFFLDQEHGEKIVEAAAPYDEQQYVYATADALITNTPGHCLVIRTADCVPIILCDETAKCIGAVHSGWKSTEKNIVGKTVRMMTERYGARPNSIKAYILPAISGEMYQVSPDFKDRFPRSVSERGGRCYCDLPNEISLSLKAEGLLEKNIFSTDLCTLAGKNRFFSHRGGDAGRNLNFAVIR